jgi:hypothetical protein
MRKGIRQQTDIRRAVQRLVGRDWQCCGHSEVTLDPVDFFIVVLDARQRHRSLAGSDKVLNDIAADNSCGADNKTFHF